MPNVGLTLDKWLENAEEPEDKMKVIITGAAQGLADIHAIGLYHQDVKLDNVAFDGEHARLIDFGMAHTKPYHLLPGFTTSHPPESVWKLYPPKTRRYACAPARDIWGLGVVFYEFIERKILQNDAHFGGFDASGNPVSTTIFAQHPLRL